MPKVESSVVINRPPGGVWAFLNDISNNTRWQSGLIETSFTSGDRMAVGARWREVRQFLGRRLESEFECTEHEPDKTFAFKSLSGPFPIQGVARHESVEGGTKITVTLEGETGGFFKLAEPILVRTAKRQIDADNATLKDLLETQG